jgi:hypothetical protein
MHTYREFTEQRSHHLLDNDNHSESDEEPHGQEIDPPHGITFFNELKKHPKVLEYTVEQIRSKEMLRKEQANYRQNKLLEFRKDMGHISAFKMRKEKPKEPSTTTTTTTTTTVRHGLSRTPRDWRRTSFASCTRRRTKSGRWRR